MHLTPVEQQLGDGTVIRGLASHQRGLPLLFFLHGNGFAGGIYLPMFRHLENRFDLLTLDIPGHGESDDVLPFVGWNNAAERVHSAAMATGLLEDRPVYGIGHSLGGALTLLSAYRHPEIYRGLVLLDPIIFPRSMMMLRRIVGVLGLTSRFHPHIKTTTRRRQQWTNRDQVLDYFRNKAVFKDWTEDSLRSFVTFAIRDVENGVALACKPSTEAAFFATLPRGLWRALEGIQCKTTMIMGQSTYPFSLRAANTAVKTNGNIKQQVVPGSHCYMQEDPGMAALAVTQALETQM